MRVVMRIWVGRWCTVYRVGRWHLHGIYGDGAFHSQACWSVYRGICSGYLYFNSKN